MCLNLKKKEAWGHHSGLVHGLEEEDRRSEKKGSVLGESARGSASTVRKPESTEQNHDVTDGQSGADNQPSLLPNAANDSRRNRNLTQL